MKLMIAALALASVFAIGVDPAAAQPKQVAGASCGAVSATTASPGNAKDPKTGRQFFLEFPCDLKAGEKVTFVLNLHGAGSSAGWQRQYFPISDYMNAYRLVIATPTAATATPVRRWAAEADDAYLQGIVDLVFSEFGKQNIKAFWLAGHSQGGATSHRIVCSDYFKARVDGFVSLAGGRVGMTQTTPACDFSHVFTTGEQDSAGVAGVPATSPLAERFGCGPRVKRADIVDAQGGKVSDTRTAETGRPTRAGWGGLPGPGTAEVYVFPGCRNGRVVADVIRLKKGHTEGLEPKVTEEIVKLMTSASGGAAQRGG